jgi:acyl-CoA thioesterase FadM
MPRFNLKDTPFYILTRSFDHKFVRETKEFETVSVKIRIAGHNRKFVTLEHEIYDSTGSLLGKGSQSLLFVSSSDYKMLDIPSDVMTSFLAYS